MKSVSEIWKIKLGNMEKCVWNLPMSMCIVLYDSVQFPVNIINLLPPTKITLHTEAIYLHYTDGSTMN